MASISSSNFIAPILSHGTLLHKGSITTIHLLPHRFPRRGRISCSVEEKEESKSGKIRQSQRSMGGALMGVASAIMVVTTKGEAAMGLVDERLSTEGTGLPFGLSNNLLGWILFGVFGLIWALYFTYASSLDEDDDSGLSL